MGDAEQAGDQPTIEATQTFLGMNPSEGIHRMPIPFRLRVPYHTLSLFKKPHHVGLFSAIHSSLTPTQHDQEAEN
jgi:hypothetical protein